ncbi:MAG: ABC transporter permease [Clostridia bacterium]|nr:ABC transporter permease [Clostridia bacterium]
MKQNFSAEHKKYLNKLKTQTALTHIARILLLALIVGLWELMASSGLVDPFITSSPSRIISKLTEMFSSGSIWQHISVTLYETLLAFLISTILGSLVAILLFMCLPLKRILEPYLVVLNSLPKIALGPLIIIWMGVGTSAIVTMGVLICIVITTISMLNGFLEIENEKIMLLKSMGANKFQILFKLILPASLPNFISVLKINVGMAWVGVIMGEYLSSKAGLGYLLVYGGQVFQLDLVMTTIVLLCVLAGLMYMIIALLEMYVNKKRK